MLHSEAVWTPGSSVEIEVDSVKRLPTDALRHSLKLDRVDASLAETDVYNVRYAPTNALGRSLMRDRLDASSIETDVDNVT